MQQNTAHTAISPRPSSSSSMSKSHSHTAPLSKKCIIPSTTNQDPQDALRALFDPRRKHKQISVQQPYDSMSSIIRPMTCGGENDTVPDADARRGREKEKGTPSQIWMPGRGQRELVWKGMGGEGVVGGQGQGGGVLGLVVLVVVVVLVMGLGVLGWRCWVRRRKRRGGRRRRMLRPWEERAEEGVLLEVMFRD
jgi:hypothetical protein